MSKPFGRYLSSEKTTRDFREYGGFIQMSQEEVIASAGSDLDIQSKSSGKRAWSLSLMVE